MKMDGTNSEGCKVSLLNDHEPLYRPQSTRTYSFTPSLALSRSRTSSYVSSIGSPLTPQLVRSDSSDSTNMQTPSPVTPDFAFDVEGRVSPALSHQSGFFSQQKTINDAYQQIPHASGPLPYNSTSTPAHVVYYAQQQPLPEAQPATNARPKKNSYPCPQAAKFNCSDHFTTSGHAARHAKKHTGKKDAYCPECGKAFTRKDNMEQHRRTHQGGRGAAKGSDRDAKKAKHRSERQRNTPAQSSTSTSTPTMAPAPVVDPSLPVSPAGSYLAPIQPSDSYADFQHRQYPDPTPYGMNGYGAGPSYVGLDALAAVASEEERSFERNHQPPHPRNYDQNDEQNYEQSYESNYDPSFEPNIDPNFET